MTGYLFAFMSGTMFGLATARNYEWAVVAGLIGGIVSGFFYVNGL